MDTLIIFTLDSCVTVVSFLTTVYIYLKVSVIPISKYYQNGFVLAAASAIIAALYGWLINVSAPAVLIICNLYPSLFLVLFEKEKRRLKFMVAFLSSILTQIVTFFSSLFVSVIVVSIVPSINPEKNNLEAKTLLLLIQIISFIIILLLFKSKRLKRGFQFFQNEDNMGIGLMLSGVLFIIISVIYTFQVTTYFTAIAGLVGFIIFSFGIYLWIRRSITSHYREKLQLQSEEHYQQLLAESEAKNEELMKSNEFLAKLVHRDNHLINALNTSIDEYFNSGDKDFKDDLLRKIQTLARERGELIGQEQRELKLLPATGNTLIDAAVNSLYIKAAAHGIDFDLTVAEPLDMIIGKYISQTDLQTLLCDHIKDAIIAVDAKGEGSGKILVSLAVKDNSYEITIFDSGIDFTVETLSKLGLERTTTHAAQGGSGIGFMTTFATLRKSCASLIITENENKIPFSKSISIRFDGLSAFVIHSYREEALKSILKRDDVVVLSEF